MEKVVLISEVQREALIGEIEHSHYKLGQLIDLVANGTVRIPPEAMAESRKECRAFLKGTYGKEAAKILTSTDGELVELGYV